MKIRRTLKCLLATMMLALCFSSLAFAETKVVDVNLKPYKNTKNMYYFSGVSLPQNVKVRHKLVLKKPSAVLLTASYLPQNSNSYRPMMIKVTNEKGQVMDLNTQGTYVDGRDTDGDGIVQRDAWYGLAAGTYYVEISGYNAQKYGIIAKTAAKTDKAGKKRKKAVTIKKGKTITGVLSINEKEDWYKLKLTSKKALKLYAAVLGNGSLRFTIYGPSYEQGSSFSVYSRTSSVTQSHNQYGEAMAIKKGTYYIRVTRNQSRVTGAYSLQWK